MEESVTYQSILSKGKAGGKAEGRIEGSQEDLLILLEDKFGSLPPPVTQQVRSCTDLARLKTALRGVPHLKDLADFKL